jgi:hypothetical protein
MCCQEEKRGITCIRGEGIRLRDREGKREREKKEREDEIRNRERQRDRERQRETERQRVPAYIPCFPSLRELLIDEEQVVEELDDGAQARAVNEVQTRQTLEQNLGTHRYAEGKREDEGRR